MRPTRRLLQNLWGMPAPKIGEDTKLAAFIDIGRGVVIGKQCSIQAGVSIPPGWTIGDRVFIGPGARFANDKYPNIGTTFTPIDGFVEDDVVIGMGALIGPGVRLGKGSVIGMGAVVTKDVAPGSTVVGNPARPIEKKESEALSRLS